MGLARDSATPFTIQTTEIVYRLGYGQNIYGDVSAAEQVNNKWMRDTTHFKP